MTNNWEFNLEIINIGMKDCQLQLWSCGLGTHGENIQIGLQKLVLEKVIELKICLYLMQDLSWE